MHRNKALLGAGAVLSIVGCGLGASRLETVPPPVQHTLSVSVSGNGSVASTPAGISCPGTCRASFAEGTSVALTATPGAYMALAAWSGACSGKTSCGVSLAADQTVAAAFATLDPPVDPCAGLLPKMPAAKTATLPAWDMDPSGCGSGFSDRSGNLYLQTGYMLSNATKLLFGRERLFVPLNSGFTAYSQQMSPTGWLTAFAPDGATLSRVPLIGYMSAGGVQANGGIVAVVADCYATKVEVRRIDANGQLTSEVELAGQGCLSMGDPRRLDVAVDAQDRIFLATSGWQIAGGLIPPAHLAARWFDAAGQPITGWFDAGSGGHLFPLIGGGIALQAGDEWIGTIPSGKAEVGPAPAGFRPKTGAVTVLGGRAYAMVPGSAPGTIDIVEPGGKSCGSLTVADGYTIGGDGSLLYVNPEGRDRNTGLCTVTYYPQVLK